MAWIRVGRPGDYSFHIEAYDDRWGTWRHNAGIKFSVGQDIALVCLEGLQLLDEARDAARAAGDDAAVTLLEQAASQLDPEQPMTVLASLPTREDLHQAMVRWCPRRLATPTREFPLVVHRKAAQFSAWYEFFPAPSAPSAMRTARGPRALLPPARKCSSTSPRWASTSHTSHQSIRSATASARDPTIP